MNASEYTKAAMSVVTPRVVELIAESDDYFTLGLIGEIGEISEHVKKYLRDDNKTLTEERRKALICELGDVLWYVVMILQHRGTRPVEEFGRCSAWEPAKAVRVMASYAGGAADDFKQLWRVHRIVGVLAGLAAWCGTTLEEVADTNITKLRDRQLRGVLHGSGNTR